MSADAGHAQVQLGVQGPAPSSQISGLLRRRPVVPAGAALVVLALAVRTIFLKYETGDYATFLSWYQFIKQHGGFGALKYNFANYNEPYLYLLALAAYTPLSPLLAIKVIPVFFDLVLGFFTYRTVRLRYASGWAPFFATAVVLFLPTVVLNSSWWGQVDAAYTSFAIASLYFLLRGRGWWACALFGMALAFKLQAIFLAPLLLLLLLRHRLKLRHLLAVPAVFVLADVPALAAGAPVSSLWSPYTGQVGQYQELTLNAPNIYQYLSINESATLRVMGVVVTGVLVMAVVLWATVRRARVTPTVIVLAAAVFAILVPFFLPSMHERYFYMADILTVISAFYLPKRLWALPVLEQFASLMSYMPFLLATTTTGALGGHPTGANGSGAGPSGNFGQGSLGRGGFGRSGGGAGAGSGSFGAPLGGGGRGALSPTGSSQSGIGENALAGISGHAVVSFKVVSAVMAAALVLVVIVAIREVRARRPGGRRVSQREHSWVPDAERAVTVQ
ncbi:MAG TPA: glycosyltransferase 87 family protein [Acidimicrobiales bacterium]|nr:glycosyltransferase 87 family protein [Acidimicrobiales bacterium]